MARRQKQVLAACLALAIISAFDGAEAAKKRSKGKKKVAKLEPLKCGVCSAIVEVVREEVHKKENDTSTLDLRWGLTAEVKEGKARRLGKVIPYKRSELLATEMHTLIRLMRESTSARLWHWYVLKGCHRGAQPYKW